MGKLGGNSTLILPYFFNCILLLTSNHPTVKSFQELTSLLIQQIIVGEESFINFNLLGNKIQDDIMCARDLLGRCLGVKGGRESESLEPIRT